MVLALWNGWRQGFVVQICSLAGLALGIWLAVRFGAAAGQLMHLDEEVAAAGGFIAVLLVVVLAVALLARLVRRLFHFAGLGGADIVLGIAVSILKYVLILSLLFSAFDRLNASYGLVRERTLEDSWSYEPILQLSDVLFPFAERMYDRIPRPDEKMQTDE